MKTVRRKLGFVAGIVAWPVWSLCVAGHLAFTRGSSAAAGRTRSPVRQWYDQAVLAAYYGRPPHIYYTYGLHERKPQTTPLDYITAQEFRSVVEVSADAETFDLFGDKLAFESACVARALPTVETLRVISRSDVAYRDGSKAEGLPSHDLFIKPQFGSGGKGAQAWRFASGDYVRHDASRTLGAEELIALLQGGATNSALLVQRRIRSNALLERFVGGNALATVRVLTLLDATGEPVPAFAMLKVPAPNAIVDHIMYGGIGCPADLKTGRLGPGFTPGTHEPVANHPVTGARFSSFKLPLWSEVVELAVEAHEHFRGVSFIGWDIAILEDQPVLVEGNPFPALEPIQQAYGPLLRDRLFREACERAPV